MTVNKFGNLISNTNKRIFRTAFIIFILAGLLATPIVAYFIYDKPEKIYDTVLGTEKSAVSFESIYTKNVFMSLCEDVKTLGESQNLIAYLDTGDKTHLNEFKEQLINISAIKKDYDQLRFIDSSGQELIRVNYKFGTPYSVPDSQLQNKADRYYFSESMNMQKGDIYISPMDLNVEQGMVEMPFKPMLRIGIQVYDSKGSKRGIFIINYMAQEYLNELKDISKTSVGDVMLVNSSGYWLLSNVSDDEWGFMLSERNSKKFQNEFPDEWASISLKDSGQLVTDNGIFTYATADMSDAENTIVTSQSEDGSGQWKLIQYVPKDVAGDIKLSNALEILGLASLIFLISCIPAWIAAGKFAGHKLNEEIVNLSSMFDPLTKLPNRLSFMNRLTKELTHSVKYHKSIGVIFFDFRNFRQINELYGIKAGDQLLTTLAEEISSRLDKKSLFARIESDLFAILLRDIQSAEDAENTAKMIINVVDTTRAVYGKETKTAVNIGISLYPVDGYDMNHLMNNAEKALKESQEKGYNNYVFYHKSDDSKKTIL